MSGRMFDLTCTEWAKKLDAEFETKAKHMQPESYFNKLANERSMITAYLCANYYLRKAFNWILKHPYQDGATTADLLNLDKERDKLESYCRNEWLEHTPFKRTEVREGLINLANELSRRYPNNIPMKQKAIFYDSHYATLFTSDRGYSLYAIRKLFEDPEMVDSLIEASPMIACLGKLGAFDTLKAFLTKLPPEERLAVLTKFGPDLFKDAIRCGHVHIAQLLVEFGLDVHARVGNDTNGKQVTLLAYSLEKMHEFAGIMAEKKAAWSSLMMTCVRLASAAWSELAMVYRDQYYDPLVWQQIAEYHLFTGTMLDYNKLFKELIERGADPFMADTATHKIQEYLTDAYDAKVFTDNERGFWMRPLGLICFAQQIAEAPQFKAARM